MPSFFDKNLLTSRSAYCILYERQEKMLYRGIAQLVEHRSPKPSAEGSIPSAPAIAGAEIK